MKTQKEIEKMRDGIQDRIEDMQIKMDGAISEFQFEMFLEDKRRLQAQYNILLEVLK